MIEEKEEVEIINPNVEPPVTRMTLVETENEKNKSKKDEDK